MFNNVTVEYLYIFCDGFLIQIQIQIVFKGTVQRDFRPPVFFKI